MPSKNNKYHMSKVDQFLMGSGCFKYLFENEDGMKVIPPHFHSLSQKVSVSSGCIDHSLFTRKI